MISMIAAASSCFWHVPIDLPLPETNVVYLRGDFQLKHGQRLAMEGEFPHARHMGINIHALPTNAALASVIDQDMEPIPGHANPFRSGVDRDAEDRSWRLEVDPMAPKGHGHGIIGLGQNAAGEFAGRVLLRIYLPDAQHPGGGIAMPRVSRIDALGTEEPLGQKCPETANLPRPQEPGPTGLPAAPGDFSNPLDWRGSATPAGADFADLFVNRDNSYAYSMIDFALGETLLLKGKAPKTSATREGAQYVADGDVRYWSICAYRFPSDRTANCLADEDIPLDPAGNYTIVVAPTESRPTNARFECGIAFLPAANSAQGGLLLRHVVPDPDFRHTPLNVPSGADASDVLGPYEPGGRYLSRVEVEAKGCR